MSRRLYTGRGDKGETGLWDGSRVSKRDPRIELNGTLEEAIATKVLEKAKYIFTDYSDRKSVV